MPELILYRCRGGDVILPDRERLLIDELPQLDGGCVNYWEAGNRAQRRA